MGDVGHRNKHDLLLPSEGEKKKKPRMSMAVYWQCGVCGLFYLLVCSGVAALYMSTVENWVERALYSLVLEVNFMTWTFLMTWTFYR